MNKINYIICTHNDLDGFCCGAILLRHYPDAKLFFATPNSLYKTLYRIKHSLVKEINNYMFICDITLNGNHVNKINQALRYIRNDFHFDFTWIDHHQWPPEENLLKNYEKVWDPTQKSATALVQKYTADSNFDFVNMAEGKGTIKDYEYWKIVIRNVCRTSFMDSKLEPVLRSFSKLERSPESDEFYQVIRTLTDEDLKEIDVFETNQGRKFAVFDLRKISYKIHLYKEIFKVSRFHGCYFVCVIFENEEISCYNTDKVSFTFLKNYGAVGHLEKGAVHIPIPYKKSDTFGFQSPITIDEFIDVLKNKL